MRIERKITLNLLSIGFIFGLLLIGVQDTRAQEIQLETISISSGLASPEVNAVLQDNYGLLWLGTSNGIQRYDGYSWKNYRKIIGDTTSLQHNRIYDLAEDANQNLWIANELGVTFFDRSKNTFKNYNLDSVFQTAGLGRAVSVLVDTQGRVWAGTLGFEIVQYDPENDTWELATYSQINGREALHSGFSRRLYEDNDGGVWGTSTNNGLMYMRKGAQMFIPIKFATDKGFNSFANTITQLYSDRDGILWITSRTGIYKYDPIKNDLKAIAEYDYLNGDFGNYFNSINEDPAGNIWILNNFRGVLKFEGNSDDYREVLIPDNRRVTAGGWTNKFTELIIDRSGIFWFGSRRNGLFKYDPVNRPFTHYSHDPDNPSSLSAGGTFGLFASKIDSGKVYVGTRGSGFNIFDEAEQSVKKVSFSATNDIFGGSARAIYEQEDGTLWIGTWGDGLIKMDKDYNEINRYKRNPEDKNSLANDQVRVIREDRAGKLWIGTNGGLTVMNPDTEGFETLVSQNAQTYSDEVISQIKVWLETDQEIASIKEVGQSEELTQGFEIKERDNYYLVAVGEGDPVSMADYGWLQNEVGESITEMKTMGDTFWAGGGIKNRLQITQIALNPGTYSLRYSSDNSHHYGSWNVPEPDFIPLYGVAIFQQEDQMKIDSLVVNTGEQKEEIVIQASNISDIEIGKKYIWVASINAGVTRIDPETNAVKYYTSDPADPATLSNREVFDVLEDDNGLLWMATYGGINILDIETDEITYYTDQDGLSTNFIESVLPGDNGEMWFSSANGLIQMMRNEALDKVTFINYNQDDGIGGEAFLSLAAGKTPDGNFYFGGDHGLTTFSTVASNKIPPSVIISNLLISNRSVYDMTENSPLDTDLLAAKSIQLAHDQNDLSFEFAALHYANPSKNQYAHMMVGLDEDWIYDNRNLASYTNLEPGTYTFRVIASNAYGVWNEEGTSLLVTVLPPWWKTWWAYTLYILFIILIIFLSYRELKRRIKMMERAKNLEREVAQSKEIEKAYEDLKATQSQLIQSEKMASLGELTAGIAHEIQNPLNFVNNFSEVGGELIDEMKEELDKGNMEMVVDISNDLKENLEKINHHGKRADYIVKGMLEHSRSNATDKKPTDLNTLADEFLRLSYHGLRAKDKNFNADFDTELDSQLPRVNVVAQDVGRVILNLINNAFYAVDKKAKDQVASETTGTYQPKVSVTTKKVSPAGGGQGVEKIQISVKDNGGGIPEQVREKIFQPFFTTKPTGQGTGLGLSLSYDIVKAHGGDLRVNSTEGEGTEMIIFLPIT